ncbi:MAG: hypothetical protein A3F74_19840 [Betaproteobacteria bacterium RIFCSPLOWO2_12_FULL_62_58]|nr:MAG: hypothetical protein A3F74_19840 [Betaproteobacteria bacterium RIFCSPLOWO2_12_FULL_62_58]
MTEPTIICPNCTTEIKVTESLAAALIESARRQYERRFTQARGSTLVNTLAAPSRDLIHPGVLRYMHEVGLLR